MCHSELYTGGVKTNRDEWVYDFDRESSQTASERFIETITPKCVVTQQTVQAIPVDEFVDYEHVKWSEHLKGTLRRVDLPSSTRTRYDQRRTALHL